jgi:hypothetical protein
MGSSSCLLRHSSGASRTDKIARLACSCLTNRVPETNFPLKNLDWPPQGVTRPLDPAPPQRQRFGAQKPSGDEFNACPCPGRSRRRCGDHRVDLLKRGQTNAASSVIRFSGAKLWCPKATRHPSGRHWSARSLRRARWPLSYQSHRSRRPSAAQPTLRHRPTSLWNGESR